MRSALARKLVLVCATLACAGCQASLPQSTETLQSLFSARLARPAPASLCRLAARGVLVARVGNRCEHVGLE